MLESRLSSARLFSPFLQGRGLGGLGSSLHLLNRSASAATAGSIIHTSRWTWLNSCGTVERGRPPTATPRHPHALAPAVRAHRQQHRVTHRDHEQVRDADRLAARPEHPAHCRRAATRSRAGWCRTRRGSARRRSRRSRRDLVQRHVAPQRHPQEAAARRREERGRDEPAERGRTVPRM